MQQVPMSAFFLAHESFIRLAAFGGVLLAMAGWEAAAPCRARRFERRARWWTNIAMSATGTALVRLILPVAAVGMAHWANEAGFGLFNRIEAPAPLAFLLTLVALDLTIYGQHVAFHRFDVLWRMHRVHHADPDIDTTTGIRFHPAEILVSMLVKMLAVALIGAPVAAVIVFEIVLNATSLFNHANISLGERIDPLMRLALVTPDMHRVHHSIFRDEHDMNFGFNLSVWDRLFGTYRKSPREEQRAMRIGLGAYPGSEPTRLLWSLALPFTGAARDASPAGATGREKTE